MLKILKSLVPKVRSVETPTVSSDKLFKACRDILQINGLNADPSFSFKLAVGQSKLPNAGYGVIVSDGHVTKGDIVSLYSGKMHDGRLRIHYSVLFNHLCKTVCSGTYFPPPPVWSLANVDGEPVLKPFHINKAVPALLSPGQ